MDFEILINDISLNIVTIPANNYKDVAINSSVYYSRKEYDEPHVTLRGGVLFICRINAAGMVTMRLIKVTTKAIDVGTIE
ncbi:hypothetical protein ACTL32_01110 [Planococcus sp. FY231025]|uniref:hypothetical protein n=1 Tax=Planococcus sp. FY231025 TaxID=3455699 RepID=UPI003F91036A